IEPMRDFRRRCAPVLGARALKSFLPIPSRNKKSQGEPKKSMAFVKSQCFKFQWPKFRRDQRGDADAMVSGEELGPGVQAEGRDEFPNNQLIVVTITTNNAIGSARIDLALATLIIWTCAGCKYTNSIKKDSLY